MSLDRTRRDWTTLGAEDPLWAVLVSPSTRHEGWQPDDFFRTGREEIEGLLDKVRGLGLTPGTGAAIDFGSGAGRLAQALRDHFDRVVGVDVSPTMIERAQALDVEHRVEFVLNEAEDLSRFPDGSFDFANSALVLQHIPPPYAAGYLAELVRVLRPGGIAAVQVATRPDRSWRGVLTRVLPRPAMRFLQKQVLRYPAPMEMHPLSAGDVATAAAQHGGVVRAAWDEDMYGGHWVYTRYVIEKPAPAETSGG
ncbi:MAG: class I SAM-dependent methyltransferase [Micrococcales bacterium]|nr:class I SAM-dependent methyltransferase [Micrococcales bacterium]